MIKDEKYEQPGIMYPCNILLKLTLLRIVKPRINEKSWQIKVIFHVTFSSFSSLFPVFRSHPASAFFSQLCKFKALIFSPSFSLHLLLLLPRSSLHFCHRRCLSGTVTPSFSPSFPFFFFHPSFFFLLSCREMCSSLVCSPQRLTSVCPSHLAALLRSHLCCCVWLPEPPPSLHFPPF